MYVSQPDLFNLLRVELLHVWRVHAQIEPHFCQVTIYVAARVVYSVLVADILRKLKSCIKRLLGKRLRDVLLNLVRLFVLLLKIF